MTIKQRQCLLVFFGELDPKGIDGIWGPQSAHATECLQEDLGLVPDGAWGPQTDASVREFIFSGADITPEETAPTGTWWDEIEFFDPEEMKCKCGGKYCDGYPHEIQPLLMQILDRARRWSGNPIKVISGLRCSEWNRIQKGVATSQHMYGEAVDVYFYGKTPAAALAWLQSQPDVRYAYQISGCSNIHFDIHKVGR